MRGWVCVVVAIAFVACACSDDDPSGDGAAGATPQAGMGGSAGQGEAARAGTVAVAGSGGRVAASGSGGGASSGSGGASGGSGSVIDSGTPVPIDGGADSGSGEEPMAGSFTALTYNVAGLPEGLSSSMPERFTPMIGPLLNGYELVLLQESWQTPEVNPLAPLRAYHEILVATADHPYKTVPAEQPFGADPSRPTALLGDGLNVFSRFPLGETTRVAWSTCVDTASDCLAFKGFSMTPAELGEGIPVHIYDLHMEAGESTEDDDARALGIDQLVAFIAEHSVDTAVIVGGDFNLHTDGEPAAAQFADLLMRTGLSDACTELGCAEPGSIDKVLLRSSAELELHAERWESEGDVFVSDLGEPLSDHLPVAVTIAWSAR